MSFGRAAAIAIVVAACYPTSTTSSTPIHSITVPPSAGGVALGAVDVVGNRYAADYSFDRNALVSVVEVPGGLIGVTSSGNLLRFDRDTLAITREAVASPPARCISIVGGVLYVGVPGGVAVLDPDALALTRFADVPGTPRWIGSDAHGTRLVVVTAPDEHDLWDRTPGDGVDIHATLVQFDRRDRHELGRRTMHVALGPVLPTSWLVDGHDQLWYAVDDGEFGGEVDRTDLASGDTVEVHGLESRRIKGFVEAAGEIWVYGGLEHGAVSRGVLARIDGDVAKVTWENEGISIIADDHARTVVTGPDAIRLDSHVRVSQLSITKMWRTGDHWRVLLGPQLYDLAADGSRWTFIAQLDPDAAPTAGVLVAGDPVLATHHGLARVRGSKVDRLVAPDQLDASADTVIASSAGMFVTSMHDGHRAWHGDGGRWSPIEPTLAANRGVEIRAVPGHAPWLFVPGTSDSPHLVARWQHGGFVEQWRGDSGPPFGVSAIDDTLWSHSEDQLYRFDGHGWTNLGRHALARDRLRVMRLRAVRDSPLVLDDDSHVLFDVHGRNAPHATLEPIAIAPAVEIRDAIGRPDGSTIVATKAGVARLAPHATTLESMPSLTDVRYLARDASARVWQVTSHEVAVVVDGTLQRVAIPGLDGRRIAGFAVDPARDEIAIALGDDGIIRLVGH